MHPNEIVLVRRGSTGIAIPAPEFHTCLEIACDDADKLHALEVQVGRQIAALAL